MDDATYRILSTLVDRAHEAVDRLEALAQERRPVGIGSDPNNDCVVCNDGSAWQRRDQSGDWKELDPIPGTSRARELESPAPADYSPALDGTTALAAVVEAAQRLDGLWRRVKAGDLSVLEGVPLLRDGLEAQADALADLERQQGETEGDDAE